jgi:hypothetical protein
MPPNTDMAQPTPETPSENGKRGGNKRRLYYLLLAILIVAGLGGPLGLFGYFTALKLQDQTPSVPPSVYVKPDPPGSQIQVTPGKDWQEVRQEQERNLDSYGWEDRQKGTVRVPIDLAMELLLKKGLPVAQAPESAKAGKQETKGRKKQ